MSVSPHKIPRKRLIGLFLLLFMLSLTGAGLLAQETSNSPTDMPHSPSGISGPAFSKIFTPDTIGPGSTSTLVFTIDNTNGPAVHSLSFSDTMPAGLTLATPANATSNCAPNAIISAPDGGTTLTFSTGIDSGVAENSICTVSVEVTSSTPGVHMNTSGDLTSSAGNSGTASDDLNVVTTLPGFSKSFAPSAISLGERSTLTFTINNELNASRVGNLDFTDNLPTGIVVADPNNTSTDCISASAPNSTITAIPGTDVITLNADGSTILPGFEVLPAGAICTVTVDVVATGNGMLGNVTEDLLADFVSAGKASDILMVTNSQLHIIKSFIDDPIPPGSSTTLEFNIQNYNRNESVTGLAFTDDLTTVVPAMPGLTFSSLLSNDCGGSVSGVGGTTIGLSGGNIAPGASCTISVTLNVPAGTTPGAYVNTTSTVTGNVGGSPVVGNTASDTLFAEPIPILTKEFLEVGTLNPDPVVNPGDDVVLRFTVTNTSNTSGATDVAFIDELTNALPNTGFLPFPVSVTLPPVPDPPCGPGSSLGFVFPDIDRQGLSLTAGSLPGPGDSCSFDVILTIPNDLSLGTYTNTTGEISATVDGDTRVGRPASDDLTVIAAPRLVKSFADPVAPGSSTTLTYTINYPSEAAVPATDISFTDDLAALVPALAGLTANLPSVPDPPCGSGSSLTGSAGDTLLTLADGTLNPGESCTFSVTINVPAAAAPGNYTSMTSNVSATIGGLPATANPASDILNIAGLIFTKEFLDDPVIAGETSNLRFTIANIHPTDDATITFFTDNLQANLTGLAATGPPSVDTCGGSLSGTTFLTYVGGGVLSGETCTIEVEVLVPPGAADGTYQNTTSNLSASQGGAVTIDPATDTITVNSTILETTKEFIDDPVAPGGNVTLEFTIFNSHPTYNATDITFMDILDANLPGLVATGLPANDVCGAGSQLSGTTTITLTGGNLAAGASCTFSVTLQVPMAATASFYGNTTSPLTGTAGGFDIAGNAATDKLLVSELGFIVVDKVTIPPDDPTPFIFNLSNSPVLSRTFPLSATDTPEISPVPPGSGYSIIETVPSGWQQVSTTCDNGDTIDNISVNEGQTVTCTFTNTNVADLGISMIDTPDPVIAGNNLTHTISISNSGPLPATNVSVSITLPISLTYVSGTGSGWSCSESMGTVTCDLASLGIETAPDITLVTAVPLSTSEGFVTTFASVSSDNADTNSGNNSTSEDTFIGEPKFTYLPLVLNNFSSAPDLIVQSITIPSANDVEIVIANIGNTAVTDSFWVDLYINPNPAPTGVNEIWQSVSTEGAVWGVTDVSALVPGGTITLTFSSSSYAPAFSNFNGFSNGMTVYAQADSAHASSIVYGAVLENHEAIGDPYNNISSTTVTLSNEAR